MKKPTDPIVYLHVTYMVNVKHQFYATMHNVL